MDLRASRQVKATIFYHKRSLPSAIKALTDPVPSYNLENPSTSSRTIQDRVRC